MERLQASIANIADNNPLIVGLLAGDLVVLPWTDLNGASWRFAVKRVGSAKELRSAVAALGKPEGTPLPRLPDDRAQRAYEQATEGFKKYVKELAEEVVEQAVKSFEKSGVDWAYYRDLANITEDFRMALAIAFAGSGRKEDLPKAVRLAGSLVEPPYNSEEESETWWRAMTLRLQAYLTLAETAGPKTAEQTQWLERAKQFFRSTLAAYPDLGEVNLPGNLGTWKKELSRLNALLQANGIGTLEADMSGKPPPPPPAPPADAPGKPADGAAAPTDGSK